MRKPRLPHLFAAALVVLPFVATFARGAGPAAPPAAPVAGWSAREALIGRPVYDEAGVRIGDLVDLLMDRRTGALHGLVGVGGWLGLDERHVAMPMAALRRIDGRLVWTGAARQTFAAMRDIDGARPPAEFASLDRSVLGRAVYNGRDESLGVVRDVIVAPGADTGLVILAAGPNLGLARHDVALPAARLRFDDVLRIPDASKDSLRAMPAYGGQG